MKDGVHNMPVQEEKRPAEMLFESKYKLVVGVRKNVYQISNRPCAIFYSQGNKVRGSAVSERVEVMNGSLMST